MAHPWAPSKDPATGPSAEARPGSHRRCARPAWRRWNDRRSPPCRSSPSVRETSWSTRTANRSRYRREGQSPRSPNRHVPAAPIAARSADSCAAFPRLQCLAGRARRQRRRRRRTSTTRSQQGCGGHESAGSKPAPRHQSGPRWPKPHAAWHQSDSTNRRSTGSVVSADDGALIRLAVWRHASVSLGPKLTMAGARCPSS